MAERRLRVTRTLVFEGPEGWIRATLERSWLQPGRPALQLSFDKSAEETARVVLDTESNEVVTFPVTPKADDHG